MYYHPSKTALKTAPICHHDCYINTNRQTIKLSCLLLNESEQSQRPKGDSGPKAQTHKAARKFHAIWCPCVSYCKGALRHPFWIFSTCCENGFSSGEDTRAKRIHLWWLLMIVFKSLPMKSMMCVCPLPPHISPLWASLGVKGM
jgi:hypothetical protein